MTTLTLDLYIRALSIKDDEEVNVSQSKELRMRWMKTLAAFPLLFSAYVFADLTQERLDAVPDIYKTLELEPLEYTPSFRYRSFRVMDRQSITVITRRRESYLLVFEQEIIANPQAISFGDRPINAEAKFSERIKAGRDRVCIYDNFGMPDCRRVVMIYKFVDRSEENFVREYLRVAAEERAAN